MRIRLGTRGSELARTQSGHVADALRALGHDVEIVIVKTEGDARTGSLVAEGGTGLFAAALREALLAGEVDIAVHSFKDLPTAPVPGLAIGAVPPRELPFDVLCARDGLTLAELPAGARVGTGSPRRAAQLKLRRPDLVTVEIRGNIGTRLARVHGGTGTPGDLDAVVLARAGLARLGRFDVVTEVLDLVPAAAQGALAVEARADDPPVAAALAALDDRESRVCVAAERAVLAELRAGCAAPLGVHAHVVNGHLEITAIVVDASGTASVRVHHSVRMPVDPNAVGRAVAHHLLADGAAGVTELTEARSSRLAEFHDDHELWSAGTRPELVGRQVLMTRADGPLAAGLRAAGAEVTCVPLTRIAPLPLAELPRGADWVVLTSPTAVRVLAAAGVRLNDLGRRIAAVGRATADEVTRAGYAVDLVPDPPGREGASDAATLADAFPDPPGGAVPDAATPAPHPGTGRGPDADPTAARLPDPPREAPPTGRVVIPGSALSRPTLADALTAQGWEVTVIPTYTTASLEAAPDDLRERWASGGFDAVVVTAGSNARAVAELLGPPPAGTRVVAFGRPSAAVASSLGLAVAAVAEAQNAGGLVDALARAMSNDG